MLENTNLPRVVRVKSTAPVNDELEVFDMMSRFLASEKAKQLSHDFAGQAYLTSSSQIWNDLRLACNSLLDHNDPRREPVAAWKEQVDEAAAAELLQQTPVSVKGEIGNDDEAIVVKTEEKAEEDASKVDKSAKKEAKKAKKEAKKMKKAAKKAKKEKKRKREEEDS